ncbi:glycosyltransferase [Alkalihalobacillus sp. AL-G]|uniref:glycosyltransferase n=1 Tax=Alkalihalobacillus sp. AL-G TaxID=2926399 RepID=UPI00272BB9DE|nr:glycosyltransferase [Alkalihalobacillus sp. AL-G]WLD95265.1 glycosyltransferase family 4 protein [Alkalihalobacillus sp. AL-G]
MTHTSLESKQTRIGFWTPYLKSKRGNSTTALRIVTGLRGAGYDVEVFSYEEETWNKESIERMGTCDLFHILHFYRFSMWQIHNGFGLTKPYVVTSGGTDVHQNIHNPDQREQMNALLNNASAITVFTKDAATVVEDVYPSARGSISVIPQSVWLPERTNYQGLQLESGFPKLLLPAGLRSVKDVFYVFGALKLLQTRYPMIKFTIVGESLEEDILREVKTHEEAYPWFRYISGIPLGAMHQMYEWADVVINTSITEGQPLALMEAMAFGVPVLARDNAGNRSLVDDGADGLMFCNPSEFTEQFVRLIDDEKLYKDISSHAKDKASSKFSLDFEIKQYEEKYKLIRGV